MSALLLSFGPRTANICRSRALQRAFLSRQAGQPVHLRYDKLAPEDGMESGCPLVILHGLFGTKRNWLSLSKAFMKDLHRSIYSLDLRNHGSSPHAAPMTYAHMAEDVVQFCKEHSLSRVSLLGHSMGGKVAMTVALGSNTPPDLLEQLIVADIAPSKGDLSPTFRNYVKAMQIIEERKVTSRREAQDILSDYEQDPMIRAFLLTNLIESHGVMKFRIPLDIIGPNISELGSFPYEPGERQWNGPTLFVKGNQSKYINKNNIPLAKEFFPRMVLKTLDAGHWVHAEKPNEFKELVTDFIKNVRG
ncbi:Abhydrolase domain-containing protein [Sparassis crispa]|uniref:Abhydrolase domain-containing protein n=1 Tax=Sparassis crispa TaxID=139825 RepID=A0A401H6T8_9APHY|nr:Abhydrolase domain-containing protein [Sparassis crispa]GBE90134.1 Abhydrolase domain-containing protein [Sparassis crispa]